MNTEDQDSAPLLIRVHRRSSVVHSLPISAKQCEPYHAEDRRAGGFGDAEITRAGVDDVGARSDIDVTSCEDGSVDGADRVGDHIAGGGVERAEEAAIHVDVAVRFEVNERRQRWVCGRECNAVDRWIKLVKRGVAGDENVDLPGGRVEVKVRESARRGDRVEEVIAGGERQIIRAGETERAVL